MGASCGKGYAGSVQPDSGDGFAEEAGHLELGDSAADFVPAGYMAKRRQAVSSLKNAEFNVGLGFTFDIADS